MGSTHDAKGIDTWTDALDGVFADWDRAAIVVSPDVDGILSAALVSAAYGSRIAGIYTTSALLLVDGATPNDASEALWVDHDVSYPGV